jgi:hypothetical protein
MQTAELIARLSEEAKPADRLAPLKTLSAFLLAGMLVSFALMWAWLGIRPDLAAAAATTAYWMKFGYALLVSAMAFWLTERLGRPGTPARLPAYGLAIAFLLMAALAVVQLATAPAYARHGLVMGASANVCTPRIVALSLPILAAAGFALRRFAPTRLILAGAAAGLLAGAAGTWIYAFHCNESAAPFVAVWYTLGMAAAGAVGGASGKWLLRW